MFRCICDDMMCYYMCSCVDYFIGYGIHSNVRTSIVSSSSSSSSRGGHAERSKLFQQ